MLTVPPLTADPHHKSSGTLSHHGASISGLSCFHQGSTNTVFRCRTASCAPAPTITQQLDSDVPRRGRDDVADVCLKTAGHHFLRTASGKFSSTHRCSVLAVVREAVITHSLRQVQGVVLPWDANADSCALGKEGVRSMLVGLSHPTICAHTQVSVHEALGMCTVWLPNARCIPTNKRDVFNLKGFDLVSKLHFARSALQVAATLHGLGLAHRDIKFDNVLIVLHKDSPPQALFIDFAAACTRHMPQDFRTAMDTEWRFALQHVPRLDMVPPAQAQAHPQPPAPVKAPSESVSQPWTRRMNNVHSHSRGRCILQRIASDVQVSTTAAPLQSLQLYVQAAQAPMQPQASQTPIPDLHTCCEQMCIQGYKGTQLWRGPEDDYLESPDSEFHRDTKALAVLLTDLAMGERMERRLALANGGKHQAPASLGWLTTSFNSLTGMVQGSPRLHKAQTALFLTHSGLAFAWDRRLLAGGFEKRISRQEALAIACPSWDRSAKTAEAIVHLLVGGKGNSTTCNACAEALQMLQEP